MSNKRTQPTKAEQKVIDTLIKDEAMQEAIALHIGRSAITVRQWAAYRPWMLTGNPAAMEKATQYIEAQKTFKKATDGLQKA